MQQSPFPDFPNLELNGELKETSQIPFEKFVKAMLDSSSDTNDILRGKTSVQILFKNGAELSFIADRDPYALFSVYYGTRGRNFEWLNDDHSFLSVKRKEILSIKFEKIE